MQVITFQRIKDLNFTLTPIGTGLQGLSLRMYSAICAAHRLFSKGRDILMWLSAREWAIWLECSERQIDRVRHRLEELGHFSLIDSWRDTEDGPWRSRLAMELTSATKIAWEQAINTRPERPAWRYGKHLFARGSRERRRKRAKKVSAKERARRKAQQEQARRDSQEEGSQGEDARQMLRAWLAKNDPKWTPKADTSPPSVDSAESAVSLPVATPSTTDARQQLQEWLDVHDPSWRMEGRDPM